MTSSRVITGLNPPKKHKDAGRRPPWRDQHFRIVPPRPQSGWDMRAAGNFMGGGAGTGVLVAGALAAFLGGPVWLFALAGLALIGAGLFCVWMEIGRPWRAINVFFHPQTSWMTREAIAAMPVFGAGLLAAWTGAPALLALAAALALVFLFCQARILAAAKGIPAWRAAGVVPLIMTTGLAEGAGVVTALAAAVQPAALAATAVLFLALLVARVAAWLGYLGGLRRGAAVPRRALEVLRGANAPFVFLGNALPAALLVLAWLVPQPLPLMAAAGLVGLAAGWVLKARLITRAAFTQGFAIPKAPARGAGTPGPGARPGWED